MFFSTISKSARVWVYQSNRIITDSEKEQISSRLSDFTNEWAAHGAKLIAKSAIIGDYFVVLAVDEQVEMPSGCSIDSSVKLMKDIGYHFQIDFFNRLKLIIEKEGETKMIAFSELADYSDWKIYNTLVNTVEGLNNFFLIPVIESDLYKMLA